MREQEPSHLSGPGEGRPSGDAPMQHPQEYGLRGGANVPLRQGSFKANYKSTESERLDSFSVGAQQQDAVGSELSQREMPDSELDALIEQTRQELIQKRGPLPEWIDAVLKSPQYRGDRVKRVQQLRSQRVVVPPPSKSLKA